MNRNKIHSSIFETEQQISDADNCAFTIAFGKQSYRDMAINLARSVEKYNPNLSFFIFTDNVLKIPKNLQNTKVVVCEPKYYGVGFSIKLSLDRLAPTNRALFIDADCLVYKTLDPFFDIFRGISVGVIGVSKFEGEMFGNVTSICKSFSVPSLPQFNGGIYYIEKCSESISIYNKARELEKIYDEIGLVRLRGQPNDEILISISLALHSVSPIIDDGSLYADFQWWPVTNKLNIINGVAEMMNPPFPHPLHQNNFPASNAHPAVVHYLGQHVELPLYRRETTALILDRYTPFADVFAWIMFIPHFSLLSVKRFFRPFFHKFFSPRKIRNSKTRLVIPSNKTTDIDNN
jgi:hypothetical protein